MDKHSEVWASKRWPWNRIVFNQLTKAWNPPTWNLNSTDLNLNRKRWSHLGALLLVFFRSKSNMNPSFWMLPSRVWLWQLENYELKTLEKPSFRCVWRCGHFKTRFRSPECPEITSQGSMTNGAMRLQLGQEGSPITCLPMVVPHYGLYQSCFLVRFAPKQSMLGLDSAFWHNSGVKNISENQAVIGHNVGKMSTKYIYIYRYNL